MTFDYFLDILIKVLNLQSDAIALKTLGAKNVLAKALGLQSSDHHLDFETLSDFVARVSSEDSIHEQSEQIYLHEQSEQIYQNRRVVSSKAKFVDVIETSEIWNLLETNEEPHKTYSEWERLPEDEILEG